MHILLTRPLEDCLEMILKFKTLGHQVSHLPLLSIENINYKEINFSVFKRIPSLYTFIKYTPFASSLKSK